MSLSKFRARNHPQQTAKRGPNREVDDRAIPAETFAPLDERFHFSLDVAASEHNAKCGRFFDIDDDGLSRSWTGERVWCNPPYSEIRPWVEKAWAECGRAPVIVRFLPANRTEQGWWQDLVEVGPNERPPFGSCLLIWGR